MSLITLLLAVFGLGAPELIVILGLLALLVVPIALVVWFVARRPGSNSQATGAPSIVATKNCPDCAELVQAEARVCKHCGFRFDAHSQKTQQAARANVGTAPRGGPRD
jgi:hypothetical protein